jgi:F-type H+-transporting ATPase subunit gamma
VASSREIQRRIKSVKNIGKVTRAMEAVSASKMRRAQEATLRSRAYADMAAQVMVNLRAQSDQSGGLHPLLEEHPEGDPCVLLITPDRGLTGGLVLNVIRYGLRTSREQIGEDLAWVALGKKGRDFLARGGANLTGAFAPVEDKPTTLEISPVAKLLVDGFLGAEYSSVYVVYADFISVVKQVPVMQRLLPVVVPDDLEPSKAVYDFEPSPEEVLDEVLPRLVEMRIYQALLEAQASEHSARMVAMRNATDAARDLADDLTLIFNKARQADITSEILDIAGGAEALRQALKS